MDLGRVTEIATPATRDAYRWTSGSALLGGGTWLFSEPQPEVTRLIDLTAFGWPALTMDAHGLHIAATCSIAALSRFTPPPGLPACDIIMPCCEALLGSFKIWNVATVGGNICLALPAGPMTALCVALGGIGRIWTPEGGERQMPVEQIVIGNHRCALAPGEMLRSVTLPMDQLRRRAGVRRLSLTPLGRSGALLIGTRERNGGFALTLTASVPRPIRIDTPCLPDAAELAALIEARVAGQWFDDQHGSPDWRRAMSLALAEELRQELA